MRKTIIILVLILLTINQLATGQQTSSSWDKWKNLIGEWIGEGNGQPGEGDGKFSFKTDLEGKILVRKNHTIYPATPTNKAFVHDDLLIVYQEAAGLPQEAIYFDNVYILIEKYTTFSLKSIPLIKSNQLLWFRSSNTKQDDKYGFETRDYKALFTRG